MSDFQQNLISQRFLDILDELIHRRSVAHTAEFCEKLSFHKQTLSQIRKGKRDITIEMISGLFSSYRGNPVYLFSGEGEKILTPEALNRLNGKSGAANIVQDLELIVDCKDQIIKSYEKQIARLEEALKRR